LGLSVVRIFQVTLKSTKDLSIYMGKQGKHILKNLEILKLLVLSLMRPFPCGLQPARELGYKGLFFRFIVKGAG